MNLNFDVFYLRINNKIIPKVINESFSNDEIIIPYLNNEKNNTNSLHKTE